MCIRDRDKSYSFVFYLQSAVKVDEGEQLKGGSGNDREAVKEKAAELLKASLKKSQMKKLKKTVSSKPKSEEVVKEDKVIEKVKETTKVVKEKIEEVATKEEDVVVKENIKSTPAGGFSEMLTKAEEINTPKKAPVKQKKSLQEMMNDE